MFREWTPTSEVNHSSRRMDLIYVSPVVKRIVDDSSNETACYFKPLRYRFLYDLSCRYETRENGLYLCRQLLLADRHRLSKQAR